MGAPDVAAKGLYLSRLRLNPVNRTVMQCVANSQRMHALLLRGVPRQERDQHNMLYRIDPVLGRRDGVFDVIVQSTIEPDWAYLRHEDLLIHESEFFGDGLVKNISSLPDRVTAGDIYRFRLRANPTKRIPWQRFKTALPDRARRIEERARDRNGHIDERKLDGPRYAVTDFSIDKILWERAHPGETYTPGQSAEDMLLHWLRRHGTRCGFEIARTTCVPDPMTGDMQRGFKRDTSALAHKAIVYDGLLHITDAEAFQVALIRGVGGGKAYGFGLLSLAPSGGA